MLREMCIIFVFTPHGLITFFLLVMQKWFQLGNWLEAPIKYMLCHWNETCNESRLWNHFLMLSLKRCMCVCAVLQWNVRRQFFVQTVCAEKRFVCYQPPSIFTALNFRKCAEMLKRDCIRIQCRQPFVVWINEDWTHSEWTNVFSSKPQNTIWILIANIGTSEALLFLGLLLFRRQNCRRRRHHRRQLEVRSTSSMKA